MARLERLPLEIPNSAAIGGVANVGRLRDKTVQISGAFVGSLQLEGQHRR